jgi:threonylcarbamoyladenosine tRNA methylthiotransferase MtaB
MSDACEAKRLEFMQSQVGKVCEVLFERLDSKGMFEGYSKNYTPVSVDTKGADISGKSFNVLITDFDNERCFGVISED